MSRAIDGMAAAARILETPVISGNVSLYNESFGTAIYPTPVVGMVGLLEGHEPNPSAFQAEGDIVGVLGPWMVTPDTLGGGSYLAETSRDAGGPSAAARSGGRARCAAGSVGGERRGPAA